MRAFENQIQEIKNRVYKEVSRHAFNGDLDEVLADLPEEMIKNEDVRVRCCIYHEKAVTQDRIKLVLGGNKNINNTIEVMESACDSCTENRYVVTETCRGCLAHRCHSNCPTDAITFINNRAIIDYSKCIECGKCHKACPYNAISDVLRPCIKACPTKAINMDAFKKAQIDNEKCIQCGACVYSCPFGAIGDKSQLLPVINDLKDEDLNVYAMVAPAVSTQFDYVDFGQIITAMKMMGFKDVIEVALGADLIIENEAKEFIERLEEGHSFMTSSCCPAFASYVHKEFPELVDNMSSTVSPMVATARLIKNVDPDGIVVFVGPCIAKKEEEKTWQQEAIVDHVLTVEELIGMVDSQEINVGELEATPMENASGYGRRFATSGGVTAALKHVLEDSHSSFDMSDIETIVCNGIAECKKVLTQAKIGRIKNAFIEGMACEGGCIKGPVTVHHGVSDKKKLESYCKAAIEKDVKTSTRIFDKIDLERQKAKVNI